MSSVVYTKSSSEAYNQAVQRLYTQIQTERTALAQAEQKRTAQQAKINAQTRIISDADQDGHRAIENAQSLASDLTDSAKDLQSIAQDFLKDLERLQKDQKNLLGDAKDAESCYDITVVSGYDLNLLTGYDSNLLTGYDSNLLIQSKRQADKNIDAVQSVLIGLQQARINVSNLPKANPLSATSISFTSAQLDDAQIAVKAALKVTQGAYSQATASREKTLANATDLIAEAKRVAASLTCTP